MLKLIIIARLKNIDWYLSCWDVGSQKQMRKFNTKFNKVASAMLLHEKLLRTIAEEKKTYLHFYRNEYAR